MASTEGIQIRINIAMKEENERLRSENASLRKTAELAGRMESLLRRADELISDAQCAYGEGCEDEQLREEISELLADIQKAKVN